MTTIRDLLYDFGKEMIKLPLTLVTLEGKVDNDTIEKAIDDKIDEYIEIIKEKIVG